MTIGDSLTKELVQTLRAKYGNKCLTDDERISLLNDIGTPAALMFIEKLSTANIIQPVYLPNSKVTSGYKQNKLYKLMQIM